MGLVMDLEHVASRVFDVQQGLIRVSISEVRNAEIDEIEGSISM